MPQDSIDKDSIDKDKASSLTRAQEKKKKKFFEKYPMQHGKICGDYDFSMLLQAFSNSEFLRKTYSFGFIEKHYDEIVLGYYSDKNLQKTSQNPNYRKLGSEWDDLDDDEPRKGLGREWDDLE